MPQEIKEKIENWEKEFDELVFYKGWQKNGEILRKDTKSFIRQLLAEKKQKWVEEIKGMINEAVKETTEEHKSSNVYIDMVGEIAITKLENFLVRKGGGETPKAIKE